MVTYCLATCIAAFAAWLERCLHSPHKCYLAATSASSTVHPMSNLLISFWKISRHDVFGWPGLRFPWDGFQKYSFLGIQSMSIHWRWLNHVNHWSWRFLTTVVSWGCLVLDLMEMFVKCYDHTRSKENILTHLLFSPVKEIN